MGTPEDVAAERYFTPPSQRETLTAMLMSGLSMEANSDADAAAIENTLTAVKGVFKTWLREVAVGGRETTETRTMRDMLVILVDEP